MSGKSYTLPPGKISAKQAGIILGRDHTSVKRYIKDYGLAAELIMDWCYMLDESDVLQFKEEVLPTLKPGRKAKAQ